MRIAIYGTGGVGGYFGGRLAAAGSDVTFIARGEHLRAMQKDGLVIDGANDRFVISPINATDDPAGVGSVDLVVLGVKTWQVPETALNLRPIVGSETVVLPLQNGVEAHDQLTAVLGPERVVGGLCRIISFIDGPGRIRQLGFEPSVAFAEWDSRRTERVENLLSVFTAAGIKASIPDDFQAALWQKFTFIAGYGGVGAVTRAPAGVIRAIPETRTMIERAMQEVCTVGRARGVKIPDDTVDRAMAGLDSLPADGTSSMQRDIMAGRPSELEEKNGAVVRLGRAIGVETPINDFIYRSLLPQERAARSRN